MVADFQKGQTESKWLKQRNSIVIIGHRKYDMQYNTHT
jgi:hypothetical protein